MKTFFIKSLILGCAVLGMLTACQPKSEKDNYPYWKEVAWWQDARYGMFLHWGISSLMGQEISWSRGGYGESKYDSLALRFNPAEFDADRWIDIAEQAGMKYIVLTTKHHDGYCLWDSKANPFNIMNSPYHKDICQQLAEAAHRRGMRLGWYFSCREWSDPNCCTTELTPKYVEKMKAELTELLSNYGKVDILWFDYDGWPSPAKPREIVSLIRQLQPDIVFNNRLYPFTPDESHAYIGEYGMLSTPEQFVGGYGELPWETCSTMSQSRQWSIRYGDGPRPAEDLIWETIGAAGGNGNMLMNVGPDSLGVIPQDFADRLAEVGAWIQAHEGILYGTKGGPWKPTSSYVSTMKGKNAYLLMHDGSNLTLPYTKKLAIKSVTADDGTAIDYTIQDNTITFTLPETLQGKRNVALRITSGNNLEGLELLTPFSTSGSVAYNKPAKASSSLSEVYLHFPAAAFDDNDGSAWAAGRCIDTDSTDLYGASENFGYSQRIADAFYKDATLEVDLQKEETITRFRIVPRKGCANIQLEYKKGNEWVEAASTQSFYQEWTDNLEATTARYWRLNMQGGGLGFGIGEFQLFN